MKKLFFVIPPENPAQGLLLVDILKKYNTSKSAIFYPSPRALSRNSSDIVAWQSKRFAEKLAEGLSLPMFSLGENFSEENLGRSYGGNIWKLLGESSGYYVENIFLVLPVNVLQSLQGGAIYFQKKIKNIAELSFLSRGQSAFVDFGEPFYKTENYFVQLLKDDRMLHVDSLPWQFKPSGYCSSTKEGLYPRILLDKLILAWLNVSTVENPWARNVRKRIFRKLKKLSPYLQYQEFLDRKVV
jgi:hypothetical protein